MLKRQIKTFEPLLQGLLVWAILVAGIDSAFGEKIKSDFPPRDRKLIVSVLHTLGPIIKDKQASGNAPLLNWSELIEALNKKQCLLIKRFRRFSREADEIRTPPSHRWFD